MFISFYLNLPLLFLFRYLKKLTLNSSCLFIYSFHFLVLLDVNFAVVVVFSPTQSIGLLSYTFLRSTGKEDIVVPMVI